MITKFLKKETKGASAEYSLGLLAMENDYRDPKVLLGDPEAFLGFHRRFNGYASPYSSAVISLREQIPEPLAENLARSFVDCVLPGAKPGQFAVLAVRHHERSDDFENRTAVHFHFGHTELLMEKVKRVQPNWAPVDGRRIQLWTEIQNLLHGFTSPADPNTVARIGIKTWPNNRHSRNLIQTLTDMLRDAFDNGASPTELAYLLHNQSVDDPVIKTPPNGVISIQFGMSGVKTAIRLMPPSFSRLKGYSRIRNLVDLTTGLARTPAQLRTLGMAYRVEYLAAAERLHRKHDSSLDLAQRALDETEMKVIKTISDGIPPISIPKVPKPVYRNFEDETEIRMIKAPVIMPADTPPANSQGDPQSLQKSSPVNIASKREATEGIFNLRAPAIPHGITSGLGPFEKTLTNIIE